MRIMLTNDDGYRASGINILYQLLAKAGHDVVIVAPELNSSGASHSIAVYSPISITEVEKNIYYVSSTPADSVRLGLHVAYGDQENYPDLVLSGVNLGENISEDVLYSGTVGAAREAALQGIPAIAFSTFGPTYEHMNDAARLAVDLVQKLDENQHLLEKPFLWNVNIPNQKYEEILGFEVTELGNRLKHQPLERQVTSRGQVIYWQGKSGAINMKDSLGTDTLVSLKNNVASITPLKIFPTDYNQMPIISELTMKVKQ